MKFENKIKKLEELTNAIYNKQRFFPLTFKDDKYFYYNGKEYLNFGTVSEFKKSIEFNSSKDKLLIIRITVRKNNFS